MRYRRGARACNSMHSMSRQISVEEKHQESMYGAYEKSWVLFHGFKDCVLVTIQLTHKVSLQDSRWFFPFNVSTLIRVLRHALSTYHRYRPQHFFSINFSILYQFTFISAISSLITFFFTYSIIILFFVKKEYNFALSN